MSEEIGWEHLLEDEVFSGNQAKAKTVTDNFSKEAWHKLRIRCKRDLFFLATAILGYDRLSVYLHGHLCQWDCDHKDDRFKLTLLPRGHFKSTIITIAKSIQRALPYTDEDKQYDELAELDPIRWPDSLGTDIRILIAHETHESATRYLNSIITHFLSNPLLMGLFPDAVPNPKLHTINKNSLQLPRKKIWNEPTFDTMGVGAKSQGRHYNVLMLDDLIGDKARDSATEMNNAKEWFDNIQAFFSKFKEDVMDIVGTRWSNDDLYAHMMERYGDQLKVYCRPVEEFDPTTGKKEPIFKEEFTTDSLNILRKNRRVFAAQYENDPDSGSTRFQEDWIRYYGWNGTRITYFDRNSQGAKASVSIRDLHTVLLLDPAVSGLGGFCITGTDEKRRTAVLEAHQGEWSPPELTELIFQKVREYLPAFVAVEEVLFSELFRHWWEAEMRLRGMRFRVLPVSTRQKAKEIRVDGLSNPLSAGTIFFNEEKYSRGQDPKGADSDLIYQIKKFGTIKDYHILDALAYGPECWQPGFSRSKLDELKKKEASRLQGRNNITGYSR